MVIYKLHYQKIPAVINQLEGTHLTEASFTEHETGIVSETRIFENAALGRFVCRIDLASNIEEWIPLSEQFFMRLDQLLCLNATEVSDYCRLVERYPKHPIDVRQLLEEFPDQLVPINRVIGDTLYKVEFRLRNSFSSEQILLTMKLIWNVWKFLYYTYNESTQQLIVFLSGHCQIGDIRDFFELALSLIQARTVMTKRVSEVEQRNDCKPVLKQDAASSPQSLVSITPRKTRVNFLTQLPSESIESLESMSCPTVENIGTASKESVDIANAKSNTRALRKRKLLYADEYGQNKVLERLLVHDVLFASIFTRQGERLSKLAQKYKVEIRVFPARDSMRQVVILGSSPMAVHYAKTALDYVYFQIKIPDSSTQNRLRTAVKNNVNTPLFENQGMVSVWFQESTESFFFCGLRDAVLEFLASLNLQMQVIESFDMYKNEREHGVNASNTPQQTFHSFLTKKRSQSMLAICDAFETIA